ncbi:hypothetical protein OPT61_g9703 [Boeremia exigua]|uniref:Uncharacterized protein n=1 Tax=Boeremia exigua TaxID=749465 RepID=A0ACC2HSX8_9PLEO|nr:hypothetical protein OPT61_g9703 [Boeremia exigua]
MPSDGAARDTASSDTRSKPHVVDPLAPFRRQGTQYQHSSAPSTPNPTHPIEITESLPTLGRARPQTLKPSNHKRHKVVTQPRPARAPAPHSRRAAHLLAPQRESAAPDRAQMALVLGGTGGTLGGFARASVAVRGRGGLRGGALAAFFGEDVLEADVEVGVCDGDL